MKNIKKIAIIKCSGSLNVGNEFINAGGKYLLQQVFPNAIFFEYEFFDSAIKQNYSYPSPALLGYSKEQIESNCDIMFICCGCIISKFTENVLYELSEIKVKKVLIGAGAYQYDDFDRALSTRLTKMFDYIFTRDDITYSFFNGARNVYSAIDLAFFCKDIYPPLPYTHNLHEYALVNIDLIDDNRNIIKRYKQALENNYKHVYVIENTTTPHRDVKCYIQIGYWDTLYKIISHARHVITNRIHTAVCCISNKVPFTYLGYDHSEITGRSSLFSKIGFQLRKNHTYTYKELEEYQKNIAEQKKETVRLLEVVFRRSR